MAFPVDPRAEALAPRDILQSVFGDDTPDPDDIAYRLVAAAFAPSLTGNRLLMYDAAGEIQRLRDLNAEG